MSDDVSLARAAGEVSERARPEPGSSETSTAGTALLWELYFAVVLVGVLFFTLLVDDGGPAAERLATGLLLAMAAWYVGLGRRIMAAAAAGWRGYVFQGGLLLLAAAAMVVMGSTSFVLFALCPLAYMTLPARAAHVAVVAYAFTPAVTNLAVTGEASGLSVLLPLGFIVVTMSVVMAITIERTERQSAERAALIKELDSTRAEVARLSREAGMAEERQRLAGDIHDTVAQGLSSVVMLAQAADAALATDPDAARRHLAMAARTARENLDEARAIVGALMPASLADASLVEALNRLGGRFGDDAGIEVAFEVDGTPRALPTGVEVVLLRAAQEALNNVRKHSGAADASVRLAFTTGSVALEVRDHGGGFDPSPLPAGYGLGAMRNRVEQVGGRLTVHSAPGDGTAVRTEIDA